MSDTVGAMIFTLYLFLALVSVAYTAYAYAVPSAGRLRRLIGLMSLTLLSGTYLVLNTHVRLPLVMMAGLAYVAAMLYFAVATQRKLAYAVNPAEEPSGIEP